MTIRGIELAISAVLVGLFLSGCKERVPAENTPEFYKLHGIINDGKIVNQITLTNYQNGNHPKLRFPPAIGVSVNTPGTHDPTPTPIHKGFAYQAEVALELNKQKRLIPIVRTPNHLVYDVVRIRFDASFGAEDIRRTEARLQEIARLSAKTTDRRDWGMREYTPTIAGELQGYEYVPFDENFRSIDGTRMWIGCQVGGEKLTNNQRPAGCASHFNFKNGVSVTYLFDASLLPCWRQIYQEVVKFTDSVLVK